MLRRFVKEYWNELIEIDDFVIFIKYSQRQEREEDCPKQIYIYIYIYHNSSLIYSCHLFFCLLILFYKFSLA